MARLGEQGRQTTRDIIAEELRHQILSGELLPGRRLAVPGIAQQMNVSQTPVREALQVLAADGLVAISAYKGARVASLDVEECEEIYLMREALERLGAREGTLAIEPAAIAQLEELLEQMRTSLRTKDIDQFFEIDRAFHSVHYEASGRKGLCGRIAALRNASERYLRVTYRTLPAELEGAVSRHAVLLQHIRARDADAAARWVSETLGRVPPEVRRLLAESGDPRS